MAHLTCFAGGMIALGSQIDPKLSDSEKQRQMKVSESERALIFITRADWTTTCEVTPNWWCYINLLWDVLLLNVMSLKIYLDPDLWIEHDRLVIITPKVIPKWFHHRTTKSW